MSEKGNAMPISVSSTSQFAYVTVKIMCETSVKRCLCQWWW